MNFVLLLRKKKTESNTVVSLLKNIIVKANK